MHGNILYITSSYFFFSSRRRHTRFDCDWSSDVCSSDLQSKINLNRAVLKPSKETLKYLIRAAEKLEASHRNFGMNENQLGDRKSTRLNSSHSQISYAVFCLKKKTRSVRASPSTALPTVT